MARKKAIAAKSRAKANVKAESESEQDPNDLPPGGFIIDDPDLKKKRRAPRLRRTTQAQRINYLEDTESEEDPSNNGLLKMEVSNSDTDSDTPILIASVKKNEKTISTPKYNTNNVNNSGNANNSSITNNATNSNKSNKSNTNKSNKSNTNAIKSDSDNDIPLATQVNPPHRLIFGQLPLNGTEIVGNPHAVYNDGDSHAAFNDGNPIADWNRGVLDATSGPAQTTRKRAGRRKVKVESDLDGNNGGVGSSCNGIGGGDNDNCISDKKAANKTRRQTLKTKKKRKFDEDEDYKSDAASDNDYVDNGAIHESDSDYKEIEVVEIEDTDEGDEGDAQVIPPDDPDPAEAPAEAPTDTQTRQRAPKKARATRAKKPKEKKPRIPMHERMTMKLFDFHPDLKDVFPNLENSKPVKTTRAAQPEGMGVELLPFQLEGLDWLMKQESSAYSGGILADEMGMGKTIQTIALFLSDKSQRPNLVVAPTVALVQWKNEIEQHAKGTLTVHMYHGANRTSDADELQEYDVILTTYAVLESVYRKQQYGFKRKGRTIKEASVLHSIPFHRVILDEAHNIKDRQSNTAKAANMLNTKKRWCLTGTPLQNRIGEIYSLIRFLDIEPFGQYFCVKCPCRSKYWKFKDWRHCDDCGHVPMQHTNFFNHFMLKNIQKFGIAGDGLGSFKNIQALLKNVMLRRTKVERADDLGLPPRVEEIRRDFFNEEERDLYQSLYTNSKRKFNDYVAEGVVLNNYANIFTLITRMRQLADHPDLVLRKVHSNNDLPTGLSGVIVCQLCDDEAEEPIESKCHHKFCRMCIKDYVESFGGITEKLECPVCHIALSVDLQGPALEVNTENFKKGSIVNRIKMGGQWRSSTKIEALVEELYKLRSVRQTIKSIVFSQFTSMLDLVEWRLKRAGFQTVKLQGSMTPAQRDNTIRHFMENPNVEVFLVSLKAGGVALNLCEASQVFLMDPWWNPSLEMQAGGRIHRIGQYRPVKITRFCIEDSIESRIIELQDKKADMINATINHDDAAISRLTPDDLQFLFQN